MESVRVVPEDGSSACLLDFWDSTKERILFDVLPADPARNSSVHGVCQCPEADGNAHESRTLRTFRLLLLYRQGTGQQMQNLLQSCAIMDALILTLVRSCIRYQSEAVFKINQKMIYH